MVEELAQAEAAVAACVDAAAWALPEHELDRRARRRAPHSSNVSPRSSWPSSGSSTAEAPPPRRAPPRTAVWLRERLRLSVPAARRLVDLAARARHRQPRRRQALADGHISVDQARVIADTAATVQATAGTEAADKAVSLLTEWAGQFDPTHLRKLGTRILDHVAPDIADAAAQAALEAEARRATRDRHLTLSEQTDGRLRLTGILDAETAGLLRAAIDPLSAPSGPDDSRSPGQRRHDALADVCRLALRTGELPEHGGDSAQIVVTTSYDGLARQLCSGTLDTGLQLTPETVRRLACDATHPARRPRRHRPGPRRRPTTPPHHRAAAPRPRAARPRLRVPRLRPTTPLVRRPPHPPLGRRRHHQPDQRRPALRPPPPTRPPQRLDRPARRRRPSRIRPTRLARPRTAPPPQPLPPANVTHY